MNIKDMQTVAHGAALNAGLEPSLVMAVCEHESSWNPYAWNPEPAYRYMWNVKTRQPFRTLTVAEISSATPPPDFHSLAGDRDNEWWGQRASWGLMQIMGAVARERGFAGLYLPELTDPLVGLPPACRELKWCLDHEKGDVRAGLLRFNGGGDPKYPDLVLQFLPKYQGGA